MLLEAELGWVSIQQETSQEVQQGLGVLTLEAMLLER